MSKYKISALKELLMEAPSGTVIGAALAELAGVNDVNAKLVVELLLDSNQWSKKLAATDWLPLMQSKDSAVRLTAIRLSNT